jgi:hypothetical protein
MAATSSVLSPPWRLAWIRSSNREDLTMKVFSLVRSYGRYVLSALAALAFGIDPQ